MRVSRAGKSRCGLRESATDACGGEKVRGDSSRAASGFSCNGDPGERPPSLPVSGALCHCQGWGARLGSVLSTRPVFPPPPPRSPVIEHNAFLHRHTTLPVWGEGVSHSNRGVWLSWSPVPCFTSEGSFSTLGSPAPPRYSTVCSGECGDPCSQGGGAVLLLLSVATSQACDGDIGCYGRQSCIFSRFYWLSCFFFPHLITD